MKERQITQKVVEAAIFFAVMNPLPFANSIYHFQAPVAASMPKLGFAFNKRCRRLHADIELLEMRRFLRKVEFLSDIWGISGYNKYWNMRRLR
jgi:hypothetical protein